MLLYGKTVLQFVDTATRFSAKRILDAHGSNYGKSTEGIGIVLVKFCCIFYIKYPIWISSEQGSINLSDEMEYFIE